MIGVSQHLDMFEIGVWSENSPQPLVENNGYKWRGRYRWDWHADVGFATSYSPEERVKLVGTYIGDFKEIFGYYSMSVGSWFIDAHTLQYMHDKYGIVASCNRKDQIGTDGYTLWGGYWNQGYYPTLIGAPKIPPLRWHKREGTFCPFFALTSHQAATSPALTELLVQLDLQGERMFTRLFRGHLDL